LLYQANDPAAVRRAVVTLVPPTETPGAYIQIATRTSDTTMPGIPHPADLNIKCDLDGVFSEPRQCLVESWRPGNVRLLGILPEPYLTGVLDRFG